MENFGKYFDECVNVAKDCIIKDNGDKSKHWNSFVQYEIREHNAQQDDLEYAWMLASLLIDNK